MHKLQSQPILPNDLDEVSSFLTENLNGGIPSDTWKRSLTHRWSTSTPNHGYLLRDEQKLVGVFLAIYSDQTINGVSYRFCNPHSWCVLEKYRDQSINLVLSLIKQKGYQFTMLTPNPDVAKVFRYLKFKDMDTDWVVIPNLPRFPQRVNKSRFSTDLKVIETVLNDDDLKVFQDHKEIPWLQHAVVYGRDSLPPLHIIFKRMRLKRLSCANIIYINDRDRFSSQLPDLRHHLLVDEKLVLSRIEKRFLSTIRGPHFSMKNFQSKLYSSNLEASDIRNIYSELVALDL